MSTDQSIEQKNLALVDALTETATTIYTAPEQTKALIRGASFHNPTDNVAVLKLYINNGTDIQIDTQSIKAGQTFHAISLLNQVIDGGAKIKASGAGITVNISGVEIV